MTSSTSSPSKTKPPYFWLRRASRFGLFDTEGFWSYPAFLVERGGDLLWLHLVAPTAKSRSGHGHALFKPKTLVVTLPDSRVVVRYENLRLGRDTAPAIPANKPLALLPHREIALLPRREWAEREVALLRACVGMGERFRRNGELPPEFCREYLTLQNPMFLPWLRQLCPAFVGALE